MKWPTQGLSLCLIACALAAQAAAIDREAFTFTRYTLTVQLDPGQHRITVRGRIRLRNDSQSPQKTAVLQVSSSLDWLSIQADGKALPFVTQTYATDIDHTGALSEAVVTLPEALAPKASLDIDVGYDGVIVVDTTRLARIGTPEADAAATDWDQIGTSFTGVRGVGYVAWYPIATESVDLGDAQSLPDTVDRWKRRHSASELSLLIESVQSVPILCSGEKPLATVVLSDGMTTAAACDFTRLGHDVPVFVEADYQMQKLPDGAMVASLKAHDEAAGTYATWLALPSLLPAARSRGQLQAVDFPVLGAAPFVSGNMLLAAMNRAPADHDRSTLVYARTRQEIRSLRPWLVEGLAHYAQLLDLENQRGRQAAIDYLRGHSSVLTPPPPDGAMRRSLLDANDDIYLQSKAMYVWWMLRDITGKDPNYVLVSYLQEDDTTPTYVQKLLEKISQRDLQWFFDDWVYHDRGLPSFRVASAFARKTKPDAYLLTVTVENSGGCGAEVPVRVRFAGGEQERRLEVKGKASAVIHFELPKSPQEVIVNDGSVPESGEGAKPFEIAPASDDKQQPPTQ